MWATMFNHVQPVFNQFGAARAAYGQIRPNMARNGRFGGPLRPPRVTPETKQGALNIPICWSDPMTSLRKLGWWKREFLKTSLYRWARHVVLSKIYFSQVTKRKGKMRNVLTTVHWTIWLQVGVVRPPSYLFKSRNDHFDYLQGWCWWWCPSNMKPTCRKMRGQPGGGESSSWSLARPRSSRQPPSPSRHNLKVHEVFWFRYFW